MTAISSVQDGEITGARISCSEFNRNWQITFLLRMGSDANPYFEMTSGGTRFFKNIDLAVSIVHSIGLDEVHVVGLSEMNVTDEGRDCIVDTVAGLY